MDLDTQIITVFCRIDDALKRLLRGKGSAGAGLSRRCPMLKC